MICQFYGKIRYENNKSGKNADFFQAFRTKTLKFTFGRTGEKARSGRIPAPEKAFAIKPEPDLLKAFDLNFNIKLFDLAEPLDLGALPT